MWLSFYNFCARLLVVFGEFAHRMYRLLGTEIELPFNIGTFALYEALFYAFTVTLVARFIANIVNPN